MEINEKKVYKINYDNIKSIDDIIEIMRLMDLHVHVKNETDKKNIKAIKHLIYEVK